MVGKREEEGVNWLFGIATKYDLTLEQVHGIYTEFMARIATAEQRKLLERQERLERTLHRIVPRKDQ